MPRVIFCPASALVFAASKMSCDGDALFRLAWPHQMISIHGIECCDESKELERSSHCHWRVLAVVVLSVLAAAWLSEAACSAACRCRGAPIRVPSMSSAGVMSQMQAACIAWNPYHYPGAINREPQRGRMPMSKLQGIRSQSGREKADTRSATHMACFELIRHTRVLFECCLSCAWPCGPCSSLDVGCHEIIPHRSVRLPVHDAHTS
jgi:hypothetical protein